MHAGRTVQCTRAPTHKHPRTHDAYPHTDSNTHNHTPRESLRPRPCTGSSSATSLTPPLACTPLCASMDPGPRTPRPPPPPRLIPPARACMRAVGHAPHFAADGVLSYAPPRRGIPPPAVAHGHLGHARAMASNGSATDVAYPMASPRGSTAGASGAAACEHQDQPLPAAAACSSHLQVAAAAGR